jgi:hypothetical protein
MLEHEHEQDRDKCVSLGSASGTHERMTGPTRRAQPASNLDRLSLPEPH